MRVVGLAGAAQFIQQGAGARAGLRHANDRRLAAGAPPQGETEQGGQAEQCAGELPGPEQRVADCRFAGGCGGLDVFFQLCIGGDLQGARRQAGALDPALLGIPPDHFHRRQLDRAGLVGDQRFAFLAAADHALVTAFVGQLRLVRVMAQAFGQGDRQRRQLGAGQAIHAQHDVAGQRFAGLGFLGLRAPGLAQAERAGRQPGCVLRVVRGLGVDLQRDARRGDQHLLARLRAERVVVIVVAALGDLSGLEGLAGDLQGAALLREDRVAHFDHAMANAVDVLLVGAWLAQLLDAGVVHAQRAEAAVVVQRHRVVDAQGEDDLGLHPAFLAVDAGVDEHRRELLSLGAVLGLEHIEADRLAGVAAQVDRRDFHLAFAAWLQGDDPARGGLGLAVECGEAVDLAGAQDHEVLVQRFQVGLAEQRRVIGLQRQLDALALVQARTVDAGGEAGLGAEGGEAEQGQADQPFHGLGSWRCCCCWYQNLRRNSSDGSSGICRSHCSRA